MARPSFEQDLPTSLPPTEPPTPRTRQFSRRSPNRSKSRKRETRKTARSVPRTVSGTSWVSTESTSDWTEPGAPPPSLATSALSFTAGTSSVAPSSSPNRSDVVYLDIDGSTIPGTSRAPTQTPQRSLSRATSRSGSDVSSWFNPELGSMRLADTSVWQLDGSEPPVPKSPYEASSDYTLAKAKPVYLRKAKPVPVTPNTRRNLLQQQQRTIKEEGGEGELWLTPKRAAFRSSSHSMVDPAFPSGYHSSYLPYDLHTLSGSEEKEGRSRRTAAIAAAYHHLNAPARRHSRLCQFYNQKSSKKWLVIDILVVLVILGLIATAVVLARKA